MSSANGSFLPVKKDPNNHSQHDRLSRYNGRQSPVAPAAFCQPPLSNLSYPCVYLSTNKALASIYIWNRPYKWMTFEIREDGLPVYNESFKNGLKELYGGVRGYIYTCQADFSTDAKTNISCAVLSTEPVPVVETDVVEDAYQRIRQYEEEGLLVIHHFESLSEEQRARDKRIVLRAIQRLELLKGEHPLSPFVKEKFPLIWEEAIRLTSHG